MSTNLPTDDPKTQFQDAVQQKTVAATMEPETHLWSGGYSAKAMLGTWLVSLIATAAVVVGLLLIPDILGVDSKPVWFVGAGLILVGWAYVVAKYLIRRTSFHYELTTQRFIHTHGILVRTTDRIEVLDIDDVTFSQGLVQRMLGVGRITLTSSDRSHPLLNLEGIDKVSDVSGLIDDTRRKERRKRSLHIEAN